jgi:hypothetical protein
MCCALGGGAYSEGIQAFEYIKEASYEARGLTSSYGSSEVTLCEYSIYVCTLINIHMALRIASVFQTDPISIYYMNVSATTGWSCWVSSFSAYPSAGPA